MFQPWEKGCLEEPTLATTFYPVDACPYSIVSSWVQNLCINCHSCLLSVPYCIFNITQFPSGRTFLGTSKLPLLSTLWNCTSSNLLNSSNSQPHRSVGADAETKITVQPILCQNCPFAMGKLFVFSSNFLSLSRLPVHFFFFFSRTKA